MSSFTVTSDTAWPPMPPMSPSFTLSPPVPATADNEKIVLDMVVRQNPFSITLDAWAMLVAALLLLAGMHFLPPPLFKALILVVPLALLVRNDYHNFLLLGPGGTPPTFRGYLRLLWLQLFALRDVYHINPAAVGRNCEAVCSRGSASSSPPPPPPPPLSSSSACLETTGRSSSSSSLSTASTSVPPRGILAAADLPYRPGPRPRVAGLAPQRQLDQPAKPACHRQLRAATEALARRYPHRLSTGTSRQEKHGFGLFARHPVHVWAGNGEVFHIHDAEKSMHMSLHPDDIREILEKGWGERHPLAFDAGWVRPPVAPTFVMIYAPRDESDLAIVVRIIEAAIWYTAGEKLALDLATEQATK